MEQPTTTDLLQLLTDERSVVITEKLARRHDYSLGGEITLLAGDRVNAYIIRGLLKDQGPARVLDGNFVLMDIAAAQLAFDRLGRLDRIDVQLAPGRSVESAVGEIARRLPAGLHAQRPSRRSEQVETMLAAFHLNLTALSWIALLVGLFLVYNTVTISVVARREEIGTLRALGVSRRQVLGLFLGEAAALAAAGYRRRPRAGAAARGSRRSASPRLPCARSTSRRRRHRPRWSGRTSPSPWRSASRSRFWPRRCRRSKPAGWSPPPPCGGTIGSRCACGCGRCR